LYQKKEKQVKVQVIPMDKQSSSQTPWKTLNITGHANDDKTGLVDDTEGNGAFDSIIETFRPHCPSNFDNGGGAFDVASQYVEEKYGIKNVVYDPFMRSQPHNNFVLVVAKRGLFDCCTSLSVLNVIDCPFARSHHIQLCYQSIKNKHTAFFKVWPGNGSGIPIKANGRYQSNCHSWFYIKEIQDVFGIENVKLINDKTIVAIKHQHRHKWCNGLVVLLLGGFLAFLFYNLFLQPSAIKF